MQPVQVCICLSIQSKETHDEGTQCLYEKVLLLGRIFAAKQTRSWSTCCHSCPFLQLHRIFVTGGQHICTEGHRYTLMLEAGVHKVVHILCGGNRSVVSPACIPDSGYCLIGLVHRPAGRGFALLKVHIRVNTWVLGLC